MARCYGMDVLVEVIPENKWLYVKKALEDAWFGKLAQDAFETNTYDGSHYFQQYQEGVLCGGESVEEFVDRLTYAIWDACECYVPVIIRATYLDDLPSEEHELNEEDYDEYIKGKETL